ncbi:MAG: DUF433 domain-containing protein [Planctomycetes bacterium]|nr:DUF433 domain-containing protein [Planctomycetota bacterium]
MQQHIWIDPSTSKPCIAGTGIRVWDIFVLYEWLGRSI